MDLGAESGRVMAGHFDGRKIALEQFHRFPNGPVNLGGTLRWNLVSLWTEIQNGLREAAASLNGSAVSVGVDTWGVDFVCCGRLSEARSLTSSIHPASKLPFVRNTSLQELWRLS